MRIGKLNLFEKNIRKPELRSAFLSGEWQNRYFTDGSNGDKREGDISLAGALYASSRIGKPEKQQDAVVIVKHPKNEKIKMMVVADGVSKSSDGHIASQIVIEEMQRWFEDLHEQIFSLMSEDNGQLQESLKEILQDINLWLKQLKIGRPSAPATTMVCAIIGSQQTLIANIGDSRAYIYKNKEIRQLTVDHSIPYCVGGIKEDGTEKQRQRKDDLRFLKGSSQIFGGLGGEFGFSEPAIRVIDNDEYDALMLFSDGVTDCLSDAQILAITRRTPRDKLAQKLVDIALKTDTKRRDGLSEERFVGMIKGGKDNTTAAVYYPDKRKGQDR